MAAVDEVRKKRRLRMAFPPFAPTAILDAESLNFDPHIPRDDGLMFPLDDLVAELGVAVRPVHAAQGLLRLVGPLRRETPCAKFHFLNPQATVPNMV